MVERGCFVPAPLERLFEVKLDGFRKLSLQWNDREAVPPRLWSQLLFGLTRNAWGRRKHLKGLAVI
eukprot:scaffold207_cov267-Pinguiococcus_pyrenoidosus.AAC.11